MPGRIIEVLPKTDYVFTSMKTTQTLEAIFVAEAIPAAEYREGTLEVRLHTGFGQANDSLKVEVWSELPSAEDPARTFRTGAIVGPTIAMSGTLQPSLTLAALPANFGGMLSVSIAPSRGAAVGIWTFTLSIALSLKS